MIEGSYLSAAVRAPVVEKWASLVFKHLTELKSDPDFELKTLTEAVSLDFQENLAVLKNEAGNLQKIPWEELIITTVSGDSNCGK